MQTYLTQTWAEEFIALTYNFDQVFAAAAAAGKSLEATPQQLPSNSHLLKFNCYTPERHHSGDIKFEQISYIILVFLLLTLNK